MKNIKKKLNEDDAESLDLEGRKVLIVEDNEDLRFILIKLVDEPGIIFFEAENGNDALEILEKVTPDLILLDVHMPGMGGLELCEILKKQGKLNRSKVIFITGEQSFDDRIKGLKLGAVDFITKPFHQEELINKIRNYLQISQYEQKLEQKNKELEMANIKLATVVNQVEEMLQEEVDFLNISKEINKLNGEEIKSAFQKLITKKFESKFVALFLYNDNSLEVISKNSEDFYLPGEGMKILENDSIMWDTIRLNKTITIKDFYQSKYNQGLERNGDSSGIYCTQLKYEEKTIGLLYLRNIPEKYITSRYKISMNRIALLLSPAIKNFTLFEKIKKISTRDFLTKLHNRYFFYNAIENEINRAKRYDRSFSVIIMDIDFFKKINDTYGHFVGDECLKNLAKVIMNNVRDTDIVCRFGGEEFIILLPEINEDQVKQVADKIRQKIEETTFFIQKQEIRFTVSIGYGQFSTEEFLDDFLIRIDKALYKAKDSGRNQCQGTVYSKEIK